MMGAVFWTISGWFTAGVMGYLVLGCVGLPTMLRDERKTICPTSQWVGNTAILAGLTLLTGLGTGAIFIWLRLQVTILQALPLYFLDMIALVYLFGIALLLHKHMYGNTAGHGLHGSGSNDGTKHEKNSVAGLLLMGWGWLMLVLAGAGVLVNFARRPWGDWDAIMIWTVRARFIDRAGEHWVDTFRLPAIHPDYPLLIPLSIHRLWQYPMVELPLAPQLVCMTFLVACILILWGTLRKLRGAVAAWLGLIVLIANPFFVNVGSLQLADVPLATTFMAAWAMVLLASKSYVDATAGNEAEKRSHGRWWIMAGVMFGLTLWIKNEGMMMLLASGFGLMLGWSTHLKRDNDQCCSHQMLHVAKRMVLPVFSGFLPFLIVWVWAKLMLVASNDLVRAQADGAGGRKLLDVSRHVEIFSAYWHMLQQVRPIWCSVVLTLLVLIAGYHTHVLGSAGRMLYGFIFTIVLCAAGYYTVYLLSPYDLAWHLETSLSRLMTHFWPAFVLWALMGVKLEWSGKTK